MSNQQYNEYIKNIKGTFAIENMTVSKSTLENLKKIADGKVSYNQVISELVNKYKRV